MSVKFMIQILSRVADRVARDPLKAAGIKLTLSEMHADHIARRVADLRGILGNLRDQQALCDRAADLAYEELEAEELNALLRGHREFLDREAVVREELAHLGEEIQKIETELARRGAM